MEIVEETEWAVTPSINPKEVRKGKQAKAESKITELNLTNSRIDFKWTEYPNLISSNQLYVVYTK